MDAKLQKRVQRYGWDKAAASLRTYLAGTARAGADGVAGHGRTGAGRERVLDVACGTGLVTFRAANSIAPGGKVLGTDISEEMLNDAQESGAKRTASAIAPSSAWMRSSSRSSARPFDVALCALGLMYAPDPERAVAEMYRVLMPGGRAVSAVWGERSKCGWAEIFPIVDARVQSEVCPMFFRIGTGDYLERAYASAGFRDIQTRRLDAQRSITPTRRRRARRHSSAGRWHSRIAASQKRCGRRPTRSISPR